MPAHMTSRNAKSERVSRRRRFAASKPGQKPTLPEQPELRVPARTKLPNLSNAGASLRPTGSFARTTPRGRLSDRKQFADPIKRDRVRRRDSVIAAVFVTGIRHLLRGRRIIRGREAECARLYAAAQDQAPTDRQDSGAGFGGGRPEMITFLMNVGGVDGTRTRGLRRDRRKS